MQNNFVLGLEVTGLGMGLVFLTLIVIMLAIQLLGRIFRPKPEEDEEQASAANLLAQNALEPAAPLAAESAAAGDEASAMAAAIAVAIALERAKARPMPVFDDDVVGEVVTVAAVQTSTGVWGSYGRLQAMH